MLQDALHHCQFCSHTDSVRLVPFQITSKLFIDTHCAEFILLTGDEVVPHKHGEKSYHALNLAGFRNLSFKTYEGYHLRNFISIRNLIYIGFRLNYLVWHVIL